MTLVELHHCAILMLVPACELLSKEAAEYCLHSGRFCECSENPPKNSPMQETNFAAFSDTAVEWEGQEDQKLGQEGLQAGGNLSARFDN